MTATCTLCGQLITAEPDGVLDSQRDDRTLGKLGGLFRMHLAKHHGAEPQTAIDESIMRCSVPQMIGAVGMTVQGAVLFSYLQSSDPVFQQKVGQMREIVSQAMEQKTLKPMVTVS